MGRRNIIAVKLTERDKGVIVKNLNACTEAHGKGCEIPKEKNEIKEAVEHN
ncbi:MAG: hypothetical protein Q8920_02600 [Bacillota bacterium]|nr:hypothetical protein [Bacillota bacterium]